MSKSPATDRASNPTSAQLIELFSQIESGRVTKEKLQSFIRGRDQDAASGYTVPVNYDLTVEQLVRDGLYDWADDNTTSAPFPLGKKGKEFATIELVTIDRLLTTEAVLDLIADRGLYRPNIKEGLSLGIWYPDLQRESQIAILYEPWRLPVSHPRVPCLRGNASSRYLGLLWFAGVWDPDWRFAAVRRA